MTRHDSGSGTYYDLRLSNGPDPGHVQQSPMACVVPQADVGKADA